MQNVLNNIKVFLFWDKTTWYALGALAASLQQYHLPYKVIKGDVVARIQTSISQGFHVFYGESARITTLNSLEDRLRIIHEQIPSSKLITVIGGPHASGDPQKILNMGADYVILGEGEVTFPEFIQTLATNEFQRENIESLPGIAYLNEAGEFVQTPSRARIRLDEHCPYSNNKNFPLHPPIELMRGCSFRCRFCQVPYIYGNPRFRSIDTIIKIVEHYIKNFKPLKKNIDIRFIAPNSLGYMEKKRGQPNYSALAELMKRLTRYDIRVFFGTFPSEIRPEYITDETISLFDEVANHQISVGFQSGSDRVLSEMRRGHSVADGLHSFDLMISQGFTPVFDFLLGVPSETTVEQWHTINLIREFGGKARVRLHYFMPLPGTPWKTSLPAPLDPDVQSEIGRLTKAKIVTGKFTKQLQITLNSEKKTDLSLEL